MHAPSQDMRSAHPKPSVSTRAAPNPQLMRGIVWQFMAHALHGLSMPRVNQTHNLTIKPRENRKPTSRTSHGITTIISPPRIEPTHKWHGFRATCLSTRRRGCSAGHGFLTAREPRSGYQLTHTLRNTRMLTIPSANPAGDEQWRHLSNAQPEPNWHGSEARRP